MEASGCSGEINEGQCEQVDILKVRVEGGMSVWPLLVIFFF